MLRPALVAALAACSAPAEMPVDDPWSTGVSLPGARLEPGVTALGQRVVVLGGFDENLSITREIDVYDSLVGEWRRVTDAPVQWTRANLAGASATLYLLGGSEGDSFIARGGAYALDLDQATPQWRALEPIPSGLERGAAAVVMSAPHVFLLGGASTTAAVGTCLDYNFSNDTWTTLPALPSPRSHAAATRMADGTLIVAGGLASLAGKEPLAEVWALPPGARTWQPRSPMPTARGGCAYATVFGSLVCAGGEASGAALSVVESYDPVNDVWTALPEMPSPRAGTQGAVIGGNLYVPGGSASLRFEPTVNVLVFSFLEALR